MSRLSYALVAALALHGALFLTRSRHAPHGAPLAAQPATEFDEIEVAPALDKAPEASEPSEVQRAAGAAHASAAVARTSNHAAALAAPGLDTAQAADATTGADTALTGSGTSAPEPAGSAEANAAPKLDLHLDDGFFMRPAAEDLPRVRKPEIQRQLEAAILADDVKRGAARGNVLVGSLNEAVRASGPVRGEALLSVIVGADGSVSGVEFTRGAASDWAAAVASFRALAARKRVRVPAGARGLRVTFSVRSKVQLPSGKSIGSGGNVEPSGIGLSGTFDVADVGAVAQRMVYAHVVSEEVL